MGMGIHVGKHGIWLHGCMGSGSSGILFHMHGCNKLGVHMSNLVTLHLINSRVYL